ncbi:hypothetical protein KSP40_PGU013241 [Platanthera guangdongensis]|uniref:Secreted protein n=1 Tax=Platanthera guangdongensis TaxID=2320717 RepID=A0ABR2MV25_9ASPA
MSLSAAAVIASSSAPALAIVAVPQAQIPPTVVLAIDLSGKVPLNINDLLFFKKSEPESTHIPRSFMPRHRIGFLVSCFRKPQSWCKSAVLEEYQRFAIYQCHSSSGRPTREDL